MENVRVALQRLPQGEGLPVPGYMSEHAAGADLCAAVREAADALAGSARARPDRFLDRASARIRGAGAPAQRSRDSQPASRVSTRRERSTPTIAAKCGVVLANFGTEPFVIRRGDRIAQIVVAPVVRAAFEVVDELPPTQRGEGGFGSTGLSS